MTRSGLSQGAIDALVARHRLSAIDVSQMTLTGEVWRLWRANDNRSTRALVLELSRERGIARVQPNFVYALAQNGSDAALPQYALQRLHAEGFDAGARGEGVRVAVVDSLIDDNHPDLKASVETKFDAVGAQSQPHNHGTAVAGTIAAHGAVRGIAPAARILAVRAFDAAAQGATLAILKGVDWAVAHGARVVNMSFAGPADPALARLLQAAIARNVLLIAASGNAGPKSPPLYPAADPGVIAVAASDTADSVYSGSVRGPHVRLAAPGVDVLLPAVDGKYDLQTGTSVAAGFVSGLAALVVQREPTINQDALRKLFLRTAQPLAAAGAANADIGLVNAQRAVERREKAGAGR
ncbi:MAG: S8 family serine peptidase [Rhodoblastus sp.]